MSINSLNDVVNLIHSTANSNALVSQLKAFAKKDVGETILASVGPDGSDPLAVLHPQGQTIGALYVLSARLNTPTPNVPIAYIETFCQTFDPALARQAPDRVSILAKGIEHFADTIRNPRLAIGPLLNLVQRYPASPGDFTTAHVAFLRVCVKASSWNHALPVLSVSLTDIDKSVSDVTYLDNLTYYYLGGVIYAVLKQWREAEEFFEMVVSAPGSSASSIQVEANKKLTLVQLIAYGKTRPLPKYVSFSVTRNLKNPIYGAFIKNYPNHINGILQTAEKEQAVFASDGNLGLVKQAIKHAPRWIVRKLTDTYLTLSIEEIAKATSRDSKATPATADLEAATLLILGMIERNEIYATLTPSASNLGSSTVTFRDPPPPKYFDPAVMERIVADAQSQGRQLGFVDKDIGRNRNYLAKAWRDKDAPMQYDDMAEMGEMGRAAGVEWE